MMIFRNANDMRTWSREQRCAGKTIGFVPTMGAMHEGHASLMRAAAEQNDVAVVSIFVNPTQFAPNEDFDEYPRTWDADLAVAEETRMDAIYAPTGPGMYPQGYATYVAVEQLTQGLCGTSRPTFFRGVATVVTKLFTAVEPDRAYFGQKDAQQYAVIKRMTRDLDLGIEIVEMPIVREPDGMAMSSRNRYLTPEDRQRARCISQALFQARALLEAGERDAQKVTAAVREGMADVDAIDYIALVDPEEITPLEAIAGPLLLAVAARVGTTRLIDNIKFRPNASKDRKANRET